MADVSGYRWVVDYEQSYLAGAACVTVVRGLDVADTVRAFGGDPTRPPETLASYLDNVDSGDVAAFGFVGDFAVAVEPNGFQGSRPEVLRGASRRGMAVSVYWNVNALSRFSYAVGGEVVTAFEMLFPTRRDGSDPDRLVSEMADLPFGVDNDWIAAGFALAERLTGRTLSREDFLGIGDIWRLVPLLQDLHPVSAEYHSLRSEHRDLVDHLAGAGPDVQRRIAAMAAERAVQACGLDRDPRVRTALAGLAIAPGHPLPPEVAELVRQLLHRSSMAFTAVNDPMVDRAAALAAAREASRPANAANALYRATNPDPFSAALDALSSARHVVGDSILDEARALLRFLGDC